MYSVQEIDNMKYHIQLDSDNNKKILLTKDEKYGISELTEFRCINSSCGRLLFKCARGSFVIEIRCPKCGMDNTILWEKVERQ